MALRDEHNQTVAGLRQQIEAMKAEIVGVAVPALTDELFEANIATAMNQMAGGVDGSGEVDAAAAAAAEELDAVADESYEEEAGGGPPPPPPPLDGTGQVEETP